jgi:Flp pilus assembly protein TadG
MRNMMSLLRRLARDRRGVSAVEFALLAPVMITLLVCTAEMSEGVGADRKVSLVTAALANLTAQSTTLSSTQMNNILDASSSIIAPYSVSLLTMTVTCLNIDANRTATVKWSVTRGGTANTGTMTIPSALAVANSQLIYSQVSYAFTPNLGGRITGTLTLSDKMYMSPRISAPTYGTTACT